MPLLGARRTHRTAAAPQLSTQQATTAPAGRLQLQVAKMLRVSVSHFLEALWMQAQVLAQYTVQTSEAVQSARAPCVLLACFAPSRGYSTCCQLCAYLAVELAAASL